MGNYLDNLFTKYSAIRAIDIYEKVATVEALDHWSRSEPSDMDEEELRGWRSARSRVLSVSSSTDNPSEAEEKLQEIIDGSPNPQNSRDRGRLRGLNEALDALTKNTSDMGEVEKAPNGSDTDMENRDYFNQNAHPNPGTPGAGGYEHDWGVGTGPMPRTSKLASVVGNYDGVDVYDEYDPSMGFSCFLISKRGNLRVWNNHDLSHGQVLKNVGLGGGLPNMAGEIYSPDYPNTDIQIRSDNEVPTDWQLDTLRQHFPSANTVFWSFQDIYYLKDQRTSAKIPPVNRSGLYDLMKFVELGGDNIEWEEFKNSSAVNNKELDSLLEVLTEMGAANSTDGSLDSGSFKIDEDKLLDLVTQRDEDE